VKSSPRFAFPTPPENLNRQPSFENYIDFVELVNVRKIRRSRDLRYFPLSKKPLQAANVL
jgi:hypothetical protein